MLLTNDIMLEIESPEGMNDRFEEWNEVHKGKD